MRFALWLLSNVVALGVAAWLVGGIYLDGATWQDKGPPLLAAAFLTGAVSSVVGPLVKLVSLPLVIVTVGLFLLVINALMLLLAAELADLIDVGFHVDGFWAAFWGALIMTVVGWVMDLILPDDPRFQPVRERERRR